MINAQYKTTNPSYENRCVDKSEEFKNSKVKSTYER